MSDDQRPDSSMMQEFNTPFDNPKQLAFIKRVTGIADDDSIIFDFFSGSATTAHAVMQLNAEDGGHRKFIMVQLPEKCDEASEAYKVGFFACYDRVWELVNLRNDKQHYQEGFFVFDIATFNERVVREAILNAVSHRNYQFGGSIFVRQFRDRLVVESPGGLPFGITLDNILDRQLPRNRRIAEILSLCGMVERSGQGMNLMFELSVQEAKPLPDFAGTDDFFVSVTLNGLIIDKAMLSVINKISERGGNLLATEDFLTIDALYHERPLTEKMQARLNRLIEMGIVEHIGRKKYVLARSLYAATGKTGVHTRRVGLDRDTNKELLLKHIRQNNEVGTPFKELQQVLPGLNRNQIQDLMKELKKGGKVFCEGRTSAARWFAIN